MPPGARPNPPSRSCKVVFSGDYNGTPWANIMWLFLTGAGEITISDLNALAGQLANEYSTKFMPLLSSFCQLQSTQTVLYAEGDAFEGFAGTVTNGGHSTSVALPSNVAACISWQIAPHYRGGHPRTYLAGLNADRTADVNHWTGAFVISLNSAANGFHTAVESLAPPGSGITSIEHGTLSFVRAKAWRVPPVFYRIAGATVDTRIDSQRRRLGRDV